MRPSRILIVLAVAALSALLIGSVDIASSLAAAMANEGDRGRRVVQLPEQHLSLGDDGAARRVFTLPEQRLVLDDGDRGRRQAAPPARSRGSSALGGTLAATLARIDTGSIGGDLDAHTAKLRATNDDEQTLSARAARPADESLRVQALGAGKKASLRDTDTLSNRSEARVARTSGGGGESIPQPVLKAALESVRSQIRYCYDKELGIAPDAMGRLVARLTVQPQGHVADVDVESSGSFTGQMRGCVQRVVARLRFPSGRASPVDVTYHWDLFPGG